MKFYQSQNSGFNAFLNAHQRVQWWVLFVCLLIAATLLFIAAMGLSAIAGVKIVNIIGAVAVAIGVAAQGADSIRAAYADLAARPRESVNRQRRDALAAEEAASSKRSKQTAEPVPASAQVPAHLDLEQPDDADESRRLTARHNRLQPNAPGYIIAILGASLVVAGQILAP